MGVIKFFAHKIKPIKLRGTGTFNPIETSKVDQLVCAVKQYDVNFYVLRKGEKAVLIDAGYADHPMFERDMKKISLHPEDVVAIFLTHGDIDHAESISDGKKNIFPNAKIYLHEMELPIVKGEKKRFKKGPFAFNNPIHMSKNLITFRDGEVFNIEGIEIKALHTPGHTPGHTCFLVEGDRLFTGDCLAINKDGGHCFFEFYNMDTNMNLRSIEKLKERIDISQIETIFTGHSGIFKDKELYFKNIDKVAKATKSKPFDERAPYDGFKI